MKKKHYGLLPAAGMAIRMRPFRYPKELLPVHFHPDKTTEFIRPKLLIEYALEAFTVAGIDQTYIIVPEWKPEIMRYLEDGRQFGHHISYLYNSKALGLADALLSAYPWLKGETTCFAMPDTVFSPTNAFEILLEKLELEKADLILGVFPTLEASHFAPVEFNNEQKVLNIWEKPVIPLFDNTWGIAVWKEKFWDFFHKRSGSLKAGVSVTEIFDQAAKSGLKVSCVYFEDGWYKDVGRIDHISVMTNDR
ncbi:glucose-1-phosphate thymidylyltransferase [Mucilaginibacter lappiensis]|uniref:glucose-1-phosphate thymidylyltransferase n=1 Tax=Mucilaginibacter lappiensis TaxID=354630 RepID=A0ABR6PT17_9SPHI|nr:sugar phosphate nucleotidyltransferase [Mucilaginibacter lappiensis]MBB6112885.1 glucose-1-phosphate thymidylyltransferase [Mucilaginibacter lappiensis]SIS08875.1 glucose-1-phosphate thymidylyltransferase [Mucilaginibacter lappiensis]